MESNSDCFQALGCGVRGNTSHTCTVSEHTVPTVCKNIHRVYHEYTEYTMEYACRIGIKCSVRSICSKCSLYTLYSSVLGLTLQTSDEELVLHLPRWQQRCGEMFVREQDLLQSFAQGGKSTKTFRNVKQTDCQRRAALKDSATEWRGLNGQLLLAHTQQECLDITTSLHMSMSIADSSATTEVASPEGLGGLFR